jgi:hypothetical protein
MLNAKAKLRMQTLLTFHMPMTVPLVCQQIKIIQVPRSLVTPTSVNRKIPQTTKINTNIELAIIHMAFIPMPTVN